MPSLWPCGKTVRTAAGSGGAASGEGGTKDASCSSFEREGDDEMEEGEGE